LAGRLLIGKLVAGGNRMTGNTTLARIPGSGGGRLLLVSLLVLTTLVLLVITSATVIRFATPQVVLSEVGLVEDFSPSEQPYEIYTEQGLFYLVNTGEELIAFYPVHPHRPYCHIRWISEENYFVDPCRGTQFFLNGSYRNGPPATMQRHPLVVEEGVVRVDFSRLLPGPGLVSEAE
jgi:hypothetical protein